MKYREQIQNTLENKIKEEFQKEVSQEKRESQEKVKEKTVAVKAEKSNKQEQASFLERFFKNQKDEATPMHLGDEANFKWDPVKKR